MPCQLRYDLVARGWAECRITVGHDSATVVASYLSTALDDLAAAIVAMLRGEGTATATFTNEPGEVRWQFDAVPSGKLRVRLLEFQERRGPRADTGGAILLDGECRLRTLAGAFLSELQRLQQACGEAGYLATWAADPFPTRRIAEITELLRRVHE